MWHGHPDIYMDKMEDFSNTEDDSDIGDFVEVDSNYPDTIEPKTKNFPFAPDNIISPQVKFTKHMNKNKPDIYTKIKIYYVIGLIK